MPATALRCRVCETQFPLDPIGVCARCFGPLDPVYDRDEQRRTVTRESIAAGPQSIWRYAPLLPVAPPAEARLPAGWTPLIRARRLEEALGVGELWLKLDTANPTHSFKDRVVAVAAAKALELGRTTIACSSTGNLANAVAARAAAEGLEAVVLCPADLEPEKLIATAVYGAKIFAVEGSYDDCSRLTVELSFELDWAFVNVGAPRVLRRGLEDARVRDRRAARLGAAGCGRRTDRVGRDVLEGAPGLQRAPRARPRRRDDTASDRRPGGRLLAGRDRVRRRREGEAGAPEHDRALARDRQPRRRRARRRDGARVRRLDPRRRRGRDRREHLAARRDDRRVRRDRTGGHARRTPRGGTPRRARRERSRRPDRDGRRAEDTRSRRAQSSSPRSSSRTPI